MKRYFSVLLALELVLGLTLVACAHTSGERLHDVARSDSAVYYVENHGKDERHLEVLIADALRSRGLNASGGSETERPDGVSYIVSYEDRWMWDMRTYLIKLTISVRDAQTGELMGTGLSYQDSLAAMGMTFKDVIERTVTVLVEGSP